MNAALHFASALPRPSLARLARLARLAAARRRAAPPDGLDVERAVRRAFELDLVSLLNAARRDELEAMAVAASIEPEGAVGHLRARLWRRGAELEAGGPDQIGHPWQPVPHVIGGRLVHLGPQRGAAPPTALLPRPIPSPRPPPPPGDEPETIEDLLDRATALVGVRLGRARRDKGEHGARVAALLGVRELGLAEPDWRGDVEVKTVPVVRDRGGLWRVKEDPAVSMDGVAPESKLGRVLWIARVADAGDSPVLSWYYQEWDGVVAELARAALHTRPKGGAGDRTRGWYLHKRFFAGSGFLYTLNGAPREDPR